jgi:hypothetical protein
MDKMVNQERIQCLYVNDLASGESHFEGRMVLRLPRALGFQVYTWDVAPSPAPDEEEKPHHGPIEHAVGLAWALHQVIGTELVIASNNQSVPQVNKIMSSMREQAGQEEVDRVWTFKTGPHYPGSLVASYLRGYKLARFIQKKTASLQRQT